MWFEAGVVALLVTLGVILVFRQLDRNNRSLEKVKRYGDRVMNTLSTFVDTKSSEIKDLAIEVQVSVKQGKELLRSVREVQEDLAARSRELEERSSEIEAIRSRIDGYDTALAELVNMSERVDDNLRRLRGEDERLRRVDDHRMALQERLAGLDATATSLEGRLKRVEETAEQSLSASLTDFEQKFADDLRTRSEELESRQTALYAEIDQHIGRLQTEVNERTDGAAEELTQALHDRIDDLQRQSSAEIERVTSSVDSLEPEIRKRFKALDSELAEIAARLSAVQAGRQAVKDVQAKLQQLGELADSVDVRYQELVHKHETAETTSSGVDRNFELLNQLDEQVIGLRPDVVKLAAGLAELQSRIDTLAINKESADAVIRGLNGIDGLLGELERRTDRLLEAKDWLARMETRLAQDGQLAGSSVREFESRSEGDEAGGESRPVVDNRDTVSKLAGQGRSIPEIARATRLSRGEVELILEVEPAPDALPKR